MEEDYNALEGVERPPKKKLAVKPTPLKYLAEAKMAIEEYMPSVLLVMKQQ